MFRLLGAAILSLLCAGAVAATIDVPIVVTHSGVAGSVLTTYTFTNYSGSAMAAGTPVTMAQGFRHGEVLPGHYPVIRDAITHVTLPHQWSEISTRRENGDDGSWRQAVWTVQLPNTLTNGASYQIEFVLTTGVYSQSPVLALSALCNGPNSHDLKIDLTDVRNQDDTIRRTGHATFRLCDHIAVTGGRDDPRIQDAGSLVTRAKIVGQFVYTDASVDPLLYADCDVDLFVDSATGNSLKDTRWVCHSLNPWMNVHAGSAGNPGAPGPVGFPNDPQTISYKAAVLDGSTTVLDWSALNATLTSASSPVINCPTSGDGTWEGTTCLNVPTSTPDANAWYYGQMVRVTGCTGTCVGGLTNGQRAWVYNAGVIDARALSNTSTVALTSAIPYHNNIGILTNSQGTGATSFETRFWHYHWGGWSTLDTSGDENWSLAGGTTRVTRRIFPNFTTGEKTYWEETGLVPPMYLGQAPSVYTPFYSQGGDLNYHPFGRLNVIGGTGTGPRPDIGLISEYAAQAFLTQTQADWATARLFSLASEMHGWEVILNEATARIPPINNGPPTGPGGNGVGGSYTTLGAPWPNVGIAIDHPENISGMVIPQVDAFPQTVAGVFPGGGTYVSHKPSFGSLSYLLFGSRHYLDMIQWDANASLMQTTPGNYVSGRDDTKGGNHYWGLALLCCQNRGSFWINRDVTLPAGLGGDGNIERTLFNDILTEEGNYYPQWEAFRDGSSTNYRNSILPPNGLADDRAVDMFISDYGFVTAYQMWNQVHAPLASHWFPRFQRFLQGTVGGTLPGALDPYYAIDYSTSPALHNGDQPVTVGVANVGQYFNGTDASDWGDFHPYTNVNFGGELKQNPKVYQLTVGDTVKSVNGSWNSNPGAAIAELPGDTWFEVAGPIWSSSFSNPITISIASPAVVTCPLCGLLPINTTVTFSVSSGGSLPAPLVSGTRYFVTSPTTDSFELSTTVNGGSLVNTSGSQSGTITASHEDGTFFVKCPLGHAVTATCPTPGQPFTDFTRGGSSIAGETNDAVIYRPTFVPPPSFDTFIDGNYCGYAGEIIHGLKILGYEVTASLANFAFRTQGDNATHNCYNPSAPSQWWDTSIVVPGSP